MSIEIKGGYSINEANVDSNSGLTVNTPTVLSEAGYVVFAGEVDAGDVLGYKTIRPYFITQDYRTTKNLEQSIWQDNFNYTVLSTNRYKFNSVNQDIVLSGGCLNLNANFTSASNDYSSIMTYRRFSLKENGPTYANFKTKFPNNFDNNNVIEFGFGIVTGTATPTDGMFFRVSGGTLNAVVSYSGIETTVINIYTPVIGDNDDYLLAVTDRNVEFWVNDVMIASIIPTATTVLSTGTTFTLRSADFCTSVSNSLNLFMRTKNIGVVSSPVGVAFSAIDVLFGDFKSNIDYKSTMVTMGQSSISTPDGTPFLPSGTTSANILNSTPPDNITVLDNTNAGYTTLGGDFSIASTGSSETDYVVFGYLNPTGTASIPAKTLMINNVYINTYTSGATMGATATVLQWSIGVGGTSVNLTETDSVTAGTRAARRLGLGVQSIAASVASGSMANSGVKFEPLNTLMVEAGTYCHIILKMPIATETASLVYRGNITINGYWD